MITRLEYQLYVGMYETYCFNFGLRNDKSDEFKKYIYESRDQVYGWHTSLLEVDDYI